MPFQKCLANFLQSFFLQKDFSFCGSKHKIFYESLIIFNWIIKKWHAVGLFTLQGSSQVTGQSVSKMTFEIDFENRDFIDLIFCFLCSFLPGLGYKPGIFQFFIYFLSFYYWGYHLVFYVFKCSACTVKKLWRPCNLQKMDWFCSNLMSFLLSDTLSVLDKRSKLLWLFSP